MKEKEKQKEINSLLGSVGDERYALLVRLGKKITDYGVDKQLAAAAEGNIITPCFCLFVVVFWFVFCLLLLFFLIGLNCIPTCHTLLT